MPPSRVRVVGSGFTTLNWGGAPIAWLESFNDQGQPPYGGRQHEAIHVVGDKYPREIATGRVLAEGTIQVGIYELWNEPIWNQFSQMNGATNIVDVWERLAADPNPVTITMLIKPPGAPMRGKVYNNCVVTAIPDQEQVTIGALSVAKNIQVVYTHTTKL